MLIGDIFGFFEARDMDPNKRFGDSMPPGYEPTDPQERAHNEVMKKTGFWGAQGAGVIFLARDTRRFLLAHRSEDVEQPGTWGTWGGAIDAGEDPETAARREAAEETGRGVVIQRMVPLFVFRKDTFRYSNFLAVVDHEFTPRLGWETQGFRWCEFGRWPSPPHFGLTAILKDPASVATMRRVRTELLAP